MAVYSLSAHDPRYRRVDSGGAMRQKTTGQWRPACAAACIAAVVFVGSVGCVGRLGPAAVGLTRTHYNLSAQRTGSEELLLNLVRLRYRDTPYFLQIASLSTNLRTHAGLNGRGIFPSRGPEIGEIGATLSFEESPTITYTPLVGDRFVSQLLEPVDPGVLVLLSHAGWSMDRFLRLFVQEIGGIPNAPTASGPTPDQAPEFEAFRRVSELLRALQSRRQVALLRGALNGRGSAIEDEGGVLLRFSPEALETAEYAELRDRLDLEAGRTTFELVTGLGARAPWRINVVLRSVLSAMFYVSHGIEVPEADLEANRVTTTRDSTGQVFDWRRLTGSLLRVRSGDSEGKAYATVDYRGHSFFIEDSDLDSKSTFSMLTLVLALQAGELPTGGPILTLPVAQ
jgi:hypothetical protein